MLAMGLKRYGRLTGIIAALTFCAKAGLADSVNDRQLPEVSVQIAAPEVTVFRYATQACDKGDIPDAPARAVRLPNDGVLVFASHYRNRVLSGRDLPTVQRNCRVVYQGADDPDPMNFNDRLWITSPWTPDGRHIFALVHGEYQGHRHPGRCPTGQYIDCWYNAISLAVSSDGAQSFARPSGNSLVAVLPYPYDAEAHHQIGYFNPTNIVSADGEFYVIVYATGYRGQQKGSCVLRTRDVGDPASWRAWDGTGFGVRFTNPYMPVVDPSAHVCRPVDEQHLPTVVMSLVQHVQSGVYLALFVAANDDPQEPQEQAIYVAASWDLISWSGRSKVMSIMTPGHQRCSGPAPLGYPSLLDPNSLSRNFSTVGDDAQLFLTRFNLRDCQVSLDRDLIRFPVKLHVRLSGQ
jgi:phage tail protein X